MRLQVGMKSPVAGSSAPGRGKRAASHENTAAVASKQRLLRAGGIQAKSTVNDPGDAFEQEADRVADEVVRMPEARMHAKSSNTGDGSPSVIQRMCAECEEELHRSPAADSVPELDARMEAQIRSLGGGEPLPRSVRGFFEPRFERDFSNVRVHTGAPAAATAEQLQALAYTRGSDIVFGPGQYQPESARGRRLIAHELTHVVQQDSGGVALACADAQHSESIVRPPAIQRLCAECEEDLEGLPDIRQGGTSAPSIQRATCPPDVVEEPEHEGTCTELTREAGELDRFATLGVTVETLVPSGCYLIANLRSNKTDFGTPAIFTDWSDMIRLDATITVHVAGYTDCIGSAAMNANLRMNRAAAVEDYFVDVMGVERDRVFVKAAPLSEYVDSNDTAEGRARNRSVAVSFERPPEPVRRPVEPECVPPAGIVPTDCGMYLRNSWWLPLAYVNNATCACEATPDEPTANCVRKLLQDKLASTPGWLKAAAAAQKPLEDPRTYVEYQAFVQTMLTPRIYQDHLDAYAHCCCRHGPAPYIDWIGVTTVPIRPCSRVGHFIRQYGSCHGTPGAW